MHPPQLARTTPLPTWLGGASSMPRVAVFASFGPASGVGFSQPIYYLCVTPLAAVLPGLGASRLCTAVYFALPCGTFALCFPSTHTPSYVLPATQPTSAPDAGSCRQRSRKTLCDSHTDRRVLSLHALSALSHYLALLYDVFFLKP